jgi:hypothetical protein
MAEFESYLASPTHRDFLQTHQPSMAYISAIQFSLEEDGQAGDQPAENSRSAVATTSPLRPGAEAQLQ